MPKEDADAMQMADDKVAATRAPLQRNHDRDADRPAHDAQRQFPLLDSTGAVSAIGTIATDVTDRKHAEAQLAQAQRMEASASSPAGSRTTSTTCSRRSCSIRSPCIATEERKSPRAAEAMRLAAERGAD